MTLPPDVQKVIDIAARLADGLEHIEDEHIFRALHLARPGDLEGMCELFDLFFDHLNAELELGLHDRVYPG